MLELLILATEPFGTWGPGQVTEPIGWLVRLFSSIANDPQAVTTIVAAFLGFFAGVLIKHWLDRRFDRLRRETNRRTLAAALRAELVGLDSQCKSRVEAFEELLKANPDQEVLGGPHSFARMALPQRRVWMAHLGRIGELEGVDPEGLILVHASFDSHDLAVETLKQRAGGRGVNREGLQDRVDQLKRIRAALSKVGGSLIKQTEIGPSWWRRILRLWGTRPPRRR